MPWTSQLLSSSCCHCPAKMCLWSKIKTHCHKLLFEFLLILQPKQQILQAQGMLQPKKKICATSSYFSRSKLCLVTVCFTGDAMVEPGLDPQVQDP